MYRILILLFISTVAIGQQVKVDLNQIDKSGNAAFDDSTLVIDAVNNRVGIGTNTPSTKLEINSSVTTASAGAQFLIKDGTQRGFFKIGEGATNDTVYLPNIVGVSSGMTGLGLAVSGGTESTQDVAFTGRAALSFEAIEYDVATNTYSALENAHLFNFTNWGTSVMFIQNNGNVGIGTTSPVQKLTVYGGHYMLYDNRYDDWIFQKSRTDNTQNMGFKGHVSGGMSIWANNNERVRIGPNGNVGIGTTSPTGKFDIDFLDVSSPSITTNELNTYGFSFGNRFGSYINQHGYAMTLDTVRVSMTWDLYGNKTSLSNIGVGGDYFFITYNKEDVVPFFRKNVVYIENYTQDNNGDNIIAFNTLPANGKIGIGTDTPSYKLDVQGEIGATGFTQGDLRLSGNLSGYAANTYPTLKTSGNAIHFDANNTYTGYISYNTGFNDVSDATLKTMIQPISNALDILTQIEGVRYSWADGRDNYEQHAGFIAQQVQQHLPEAVTESGPGLLGVYSPAILSVAVQAIKEQQMVIETQEQKIQELETIINSLITDIEMLKNK